MAEELYLSILTRRPSAEESKEVADFLKDGTRDRGGRAAGPGVGAAGIGGISVQSLIFH